MFLERVEKFKKYKNAFEQNKTLYLQDENILIIKVGDYDQDFYNKIIFNQDEKEKIVYYLTEEITEKEGNRIDDNRIDDILSDILLGSLYKKNFVVYFKEDAKFLRELLFYPLTGMSVKCVFSLDNDILRIVREFFDSIFNSRILPIPYMQLFLKLSFFLLNNRNFPNNNFYFQDLLLVYFVKKESLKLYKFYPLVIKKFFERIKPEDFLEILYRSILFYSNKEINYENELKVLKIIENGFYAQEDITYFSNLNDFISSDIIGKIAIIKFNERELHQLFDETLIKTFFQNSIRFYEVCLDITDISDNEIMKIFDMFGKYSEISLIIKYKQLDLLKEFSFFNSNLYISECDFENCEECAVFKSNFNFPAYERFLVFNDSEINLFYEFPFIYETCKIFLNSFSKESFSKENKA